LHRTRSQLRLTPSSPPFPPPTRAPLCSYVRMLAGPRYHKREDKLKLSAQHHKTAADNKRQVIEYLVSMIAEAKKLVEKHGAPPLKPKHTEYKMYP